MCQRVELPGGGVAIVCGIRERSRKCAFCNSDRPATVLCDFPISEARSGLPITCDKPMCTACARQVGPDRDHCPDHAIHAVRKTILDPQSAVDLDKAGYRYVSNGICRGCQSEIAWYRTPKSKMMPMSHVAGGMLISHFADCPNRKAFSHANKVHAERANGKKPEQKTLF